VRERLVGGAALTVLLLAALSGLTLSNDPGQPDDGVSDLSEHELLAEARELLAGFWATRDTRGFLDQTEERTLPSEPLRVLLLFEQLNQMFERIPFEVVEEELISVRGAQVVRLRIGQVNWGVTPDLRILLGCRVAVARVSGSTDLTGVRLVAVDLDILVHRVEVAAVLGPEGDERIVLDGHPELASGFRGQAELQDPDLVIGGRRALAPPGDVTLRPGFGLLFLFELTEADDLESVSAASFRYVWPDGGIRIEIDTVEWLVGDESLWPDRIHEG
jgi:hypothetical protein